jgi:DNA-binding CsgD family transcriptional regulator/tetratricopeptide (TPR) repeat protein
LLVVVDDAQWVDRSSLDALRFAFRRLREEQVAVLLATRVDDPAVFGKREFSGITLAGIDAAATGALLGERVGEDVDSRVAERIQSATGGNPSALVEIAAHLDRRQIKGLDPIEEPLPVKRTAEQLFAVQIDELAAMARLALLVAALSTSRRLAPVLDALNRLGLDVSTLESAEDAGLIQLEPDALTFRHPLVCSAVVHGSAASDRRRAHAALATTPVGRSEDGQAYHLAAAALGPDRAAADALWASAHRSLSRGGWATTGIALERSARLTPQFAGRLDRLLDAADAAWMAGRVSSTLRLLREVLGEAGDGPQRDRARRLHTRIGLHSGNVFEALGDLDVGAPCGSEPHIAVGLLADAVEVAVLAGNVRRGIEAGERAHRLAQDDDASRFTGVFAFGQAMDAAGRSAEARQPLEDALTKLSERPSLQTDPLACSRGAEAAGRLGRLSEGLELAARACTLAQDLGAHEPLAHALIALATLEVDAGRWAQACAHAEHGLERARDGHCARTALRCLEQLAWLRAVQGRTAECRRHAEEANMVAAHAGFVGRRASGPLGILELGLGHPEECVRLLARDDGIPNPDLIEALVRCGRVAEAKSCPQPGGATGYRCRGLWTGDETFDAEFATALALHASDASAGGAEPFAAARTQLCYGERLRRAGRRIDARVQLRAARDEFQRLGALPWADRAGVELRATGERLGRQTARSGDDLTKQEHQVATLAADGATNKAIASSLFLSPKTVDFHLRRAFRKLDVSSRGELIKLFATAAR